MPFQLHPEGEEEPAVNTGGKPSWAEEKHMPRPWGPVKQQKGCSDWRAVCMEQHQGLERTEGGARSY